MKIIIIIIGYKYDLSWFSSKRSIEQGLPEIKNQLILSKFCSNKRFAFGFIDNSDQSKSYLCCSFDSICVFITSSDS